MASQSAPGIPTEQMETRDPFAQVSPIGTKERTPPRHGKGKFVEEDVAPSGTLASGVAPVMYSSLADLPPPIPSTIHGNGASPLYAESPYSQQDGPQPVPMPMPMPSSQQPVPMPEPMPSGAQGPAFAPSATGAVQPASTSQAPPATIQPTTTAQPVATTARGSIAGTSTTTTTGERIPVADAGAAGAGTRAAGVTIVEVEEKHVPFKDKVKGYAKITRGTFLGKPELKEEGERILEGENPQAVEAEVQARHRTGSTSM